MNNEETVRRNISNTPQPLPSLDSHELSKLDMFLLKNMINK